MIQIVDIKPLSVNRCWQGRRFKTKEYKSYEKEMLLKLKRLPMPPPPYEIAIVFFMSNIMSDLDNPVKPFLDLLQKKYSFNDRSIMKMSVEKRKCLKGNERISFFINHF